MKSVFNNFHRYYHHHHHDHHNHCFHHHHHHYHHPLGTLPTHRELVEHMINNNHNVDDNNHNETDTVTVEDNNTVADTLDEEGGSHDIYASYTGRC